MTGFTVVIPAYNEEDGIRDIVERVLSIRPKLSPIGIDEFQLVVVDDGSSDETAKIASSITDVEVLRHPQNKGYGAALKTGFCHARGDLIGFLDADGTYPPEHFPNLCRAAMNGNDLVIGSRMAGAESRMPRTRRVGNFFFATLLSLLGWKRVTDSASGMRVFRREIMDRVYPLPDGLNLTPVMSTRAIHEGIRMVEVPIPYEERLGRSKLSVVRDGSVFLQSILWTVMTYNPVRILGILGLAGLLLAGFIAAGLVLARIRGIVSLGPWGVVAVYGAQLSAVTGISLFALGTTFNYLVSLFYRQPIRQGLLGRPLFDPPLENHFGWLGTVAILGGIGVATVSLILGLQGWPIERLWLYLLGGALVVLAGVQLTIYWILIRVLAEISEREAGPTVGEEAPAEV